jgi:hypothetical protein
MTTTPVFRKASGKIGTGIFCLVVLMPFCLFAARYKAVKGSRIECSVDASLHKALLNGLTAAIDYDPSTKKLSSFILQGDARTLSGTDATWIELLRSPAGFYTQNFPEIEFRSDSIKQDGNRIVYRVSGIWHIRGRSVRGSMQLTVLPFSDAFLFRGTSSLRVADCNMSSTISSRGVLELFIEVRSGLVH